MGFFRPTRAVLSIAGALVVVTAVVVAFAMHGGGAAPATPTTTKVLRGTVTLAVSASGTVSSTQTRGLSFSVSGTVTEVNVKAGDTVTAGQVLARIDPTDAQAAVDSAQSRVNDAQDAVTRAEQASTVTACPTSQPRTAAPTPSRSATPAATPTPSRTGGTALAAAAACSSAGPRNNGSGDSLLSAEMQLNNAELALLQARERLAGTVITAPIGGRVLSVGGKVGSKASPGGTGFVVLGDVSTLAIKAQFSEADVGRLAIGQVAAITLPNRADPLPGKVSQIDPAGTVSSRLVRYGVIIAFDAVPVDLLLGQSATVMVTTAAVDNVLYVSSSAVSNVDAGAGTVTVRSAGHDETRTVKLGLRGDQYTEVTSGVTEGDVIVLPSST
jgi:multidrug efflux pump subunit AcrA (membrane-fusion protein)